MKLYHAPQVNVRLQGGETRDLSAVLKWAVDQRQSEKLWSPVHELPFNNFHNFSIFFA